MESLLSLCRHISMPEEITQQLIQLSPFLDSKLFSLLPDARVPKPKQAEQLKVLEAALAPDPMGLKILCLMLQAALRVRDAYHRTGIPDEIYYATMHCFTRFVNEHLESYGSYGFDRGYWTVKQLYLLVFRIGGLEFERACFDGVPTLRLQVPSDSRLDLPLLRSSYLEARAFFARYFPEYAGAPVHCNSWLLSPTLLTLLPPESRILQFQKSFTIRPVPEPNDCYALWVFKNPHLAPEDYPEDTGLQRSLKSYLLSGGQYYEGEGYLTDDPFLPDSPKK